MAVYKVQGSDGTIHLFEGPDDATPEEVEAAAGEYFASSPEVPAPAPAPEDRRQPQKRAWLDPARREAVAEVLAALGTGAIAQPLSGLAGIAAGLLPGPEGQSAEGVRRVSEAFTYAPRSEEAQKALGVMAVPFELLKSGAGYLGETIGEKVFGAPLGGEMVGEILGQAVPQFLPLGIGLRSLRARMKSVSPKVENVTVAREAGYVVPPKLDPQAGRATRLIEKFAGEKNVAQMAARKNQTVTQNLVKKDLGISREEPLTLDAVQQVRKEAEQVHEQLKSHPADFRATRKYLDKVKGFDKQIVDEYPELFKVKDTGPQTKISPEAAVAAANKLRNDARANLKTSTQPQKQELGHAQYEAANAIEDLIEFNLRKRGEHDLMQGFRDARTKLAKAHDVEVAMNETTGEIDALSLGRTLKNRRGQLTEGIAQAARFGKAFPEVARSPSSYATGIEMGDLLGLGLSGSIGYGLGGWPGAAALMVAKPAAGRLVISPAYRPATMAGTSQALGSLTTLGTAQRPQPQPQPQPEPQGFRHGGLAALQFAAGGPVASYLRNVKSDPRITQDLMGFVEQAESSGNPLSVSPKGALGALQLMPGTARDLGVDPFNPAQAREGAERYLNWLIGQTGNLPDAIAAYNVGIGAFKRLGRENLPKETRQFVAKVMAQVGKAQAEQPDSIVSQPWNASDPIPPPAPQGEIPPSTSQLIPVPYRAAPYTPPYTPPTFSRDSPLAMVEKLLRNPLSLAQET